MRHFLLVMLMLVPLTPVWAQSGQVYLAGQRQPTQVTIFPVYQQYDDDGVKISEFSVPVVAFFPLKRNLGVSLHVSQANASADGFESLSGLTDVQLAASYFRRVGEGSVVLNLGLNLPSGKQDLTDEEFNTLLLVSRNVFDFRVPGFGRGLGIAPSITWAQPLSERFVVGVGVSFQYRASFDPVEGLAGSFDPGEEVLLTGGFNARVGAGASLSGDVSVTLYGTDTLGDVDVFEAGAKTVVTAQYRQTRGFNVLWLLARYRTRAEGSLIENGTTLDAGKLNPDQFELRGQYRYRVHQGLYVGAHAQARLLDEALNVEKTNLLGAGVSAEFTVSPQVRVPLRFTYVFGDLTGLETGVGLIINL